MKPEVTSGCFLLLALSIVALPCPAQDRKASPFDLIPAGTHLVLSMDGPAVLAKKFAGTRMRKLFGSDAFADLVRKHWKPVEPMLKKKLEALSLDLDDLRQQLLDYSGKVVLAFHLGDKAIDFSRPPQELTLTVLLSPDGKTPLKEICSKIAEAIKEEESDRLEEVEFEGKTFFQMQTGGGNRLLVPFMHKGQCVFILCKDPGVALRRILNPEQKPSYRPRAQLAHKGMFMDLNLSGVMGLVRRSIQRLDEDQDSDWTRLFDDLGGRSLERLELMAEARSPYVVQETRLQMNDSRLGLLAALFPGQPGRSPLETMLPGDIQTAGVFFLSLPRLYAAAKSALKDHTDLPFTFSSLEDGFETMFELRLQEDVLDHVGGHVLYMEHTATDSEDDEEFDGFNPVAEALRGMRPYCLAVSLRDREAFAESLEQIIRKRGLHAARKTRDYKGFKVGKINLAGLTSLHYVITSRALLLAIGDGGGVRAMHSALDCESRVAKGEEPLPLRKDIADRVAIEPDDHYGIGYDDLAAIFGMVRQEYDDMRKLMEEYYDGGLEEAMREDASLRVMVPLMKVMIEFADLLKPFDLGMTTAVLRYKAREIVQRSIW